jgi:hypothetical protein
MCRQAVGFERPMQVAVSDAVLEQLQGCTHRFNLCQALPQAEAWPCVEAEVAVGRGHGVQPQPA